MTRSIYPFFNWATLQMQYEHPWKADGWYKMQLLCHYQTTDSIYCTTTAETCKLPTTLAQGWSCSHRLQITGISSESWQAIVTSSARTERASAISWAPEDFCWSPCRSITVKVCSDSRHIFQISVGPARCGHGAGACTEGKKLLTSPRGAREDKSPWKWRELSGFRTYIYSEKSNPAILKSFTDKKQQQQKIWKLAILVLTQEREVYTTEKMLWQEWCSTSNSLQSFKHC